MTIQETQQQIQQRQTEISQAKEQLQKAQQSIPETSQRQLRGQAAQAGLAGRQLQRQLAGAREEVSKQKEYVGEVEKSVKDYEKQFNEYLTSDSGKLQFAKESGIKGQPIYGKIAKGYANEVLGYKYSTPYGEVTDWSPRDKIIMSELKQEAKAHGFGSNVEEYISVSNAMSKQMASSPSSLSSADISKTISVDKIPIIQTLPSPQQFTRGSTDLATGMPTGGQNGLNQFRNLVTGMASSGINLVSAKSNQTKIESTGTNANPSILSRVKQIFTTDNSREIYNPSLSGFVKAEQALSGRTETAIIRPQTLIEQQQIKEADIKGAAVTAIPSQYLGGMLNKQFNQETLQRFESPTFIGRFGAALNPINQYELAKYNELLKQDIFKANELKNKYDSGQLTQEQYNQRLSSLQEQSQGRLNQYTTTIEKSIGESSLTPTQKTLAGAGISATQVLPYFSPLGRIVLGTEQTREGLQSFQMAQTPQEKLIAGGQTAFGIFTAASGVKPLFGGQVMPSQSKYSNLIRYGGGTILGLGFGGLDYYSTLKETGSQPYALGRALGTGGTIIVPALAPLSPIKYDSVGIKTELPSVGLEGTKADIAKVASKAGGYIAGSSAIEARYGTEYFRKGADLDVYVKVKGDFNDVKFDKENKLKVQKVTDAIRTELDKKGIKYEEFAGQFTDPKTGRTIVEVKPRGGEAAKDKVIDIQGIKFRSPSEVIADKEAILRAFKKGEPIQEQKLLKTQADIQLIKSLPEPSDKTIYRGLYFNLGGEGNARPIIGLGELQGLKTNLVFGTPTEKSIPSIKNAIGLIGQYPETPLATKILTSEKNIKQLVTQKDIPKVELIKKINKAGANIKKLNEGDFPKKLSSSEAGTLLNQKELGNVYKYMKTNPEYLTLYEKFYGSVPEIAQRTKTVLRDPHDIELQFRTKEQAEAYGKALVEQINKAAGKNKAYLDNPQGKLGVFVKTDKGVIDKAIELKTPEEAAMEQGSLTGFRYGYLEDRPTINLGDFKNVQAWGEQLIRKTGASGMWKYNTELKKFEINPEAWRAKDVIDVYAQIKSAVYYKKMPQSMEKVAEEWRAKWSEDPRIAERFASLDKADIRVDITGTLKQNYNMDESISPTISMSSIPMSTSNIPASRELVLIASPSETKKVSESVSQVSSISPSISLFKSISPSPSISPTISSSVPVSISPSISISTSVSPSISPSPSPSKSPSLSPSPSPSPSKSPSGYSFGFKKYSSRDTLKAIAKEEGFDIFAKVKGKDTLIGSEETPYLASKRLKSFLKSNISASGFVQSEKTGRKLEASELGFDNIFRQSKTQPFRLVQRLGTRLSSFGEIRDIQRNKKNKSKKISFW